MTIGRELQAVTRAGGDLVALAEWLAAEVAPAADEHDRAGTYPHASLELARDHGYLAAPIPERLGGLSVSTVHDLVVAASRLARGDASLAIGVNMHWVAVSNMERRRRAAVATGDDRRARAFSESLEAIARERTVLAAAISEPHQDLMHPKTRAQRIDGGWRIDGRKVFCTMSPAATVLYTAVAYANGDGTDHYAYAMVPADTEGVLVHGDWDALGMRASGSHTVSFRQVEIPEHALRGGFSAGAVAPFLDRNVTAGLFHAAASLGIAEGAHAHVLDAVERRGGPAEGDGRARVLAAESTMDLAASRAVIARAATLVDANDDAHPHPDAAGSEADLLAVFAEVQAAKAFVNEAATRVVDRALSLSGGGGYRSASPLSRAYRDVRAGAFMHPLGANRAYDVLGRIAFGQDPELG
jgi:alkylation response protein AidB-like acyl-CoA dehydrogenase